MQAGDQLNFIEPFSGEPQHSLAESEKISLEDLATLNVVLKRFITDNKENVHSFDVLESYGMVSIDEASYKLEMPDGSYLHVLVFVTKFDQGIIEFGISVMEHLDDAVFNGGYTYIYDADEGLIRSKALKDDPGTYDEDDDDIRKLHFTISDLYENREELYDMEQSEDPDVVAHALEARAQLGSEIQFDELMQAQGMDSQPPHPGELEKLRELIWDAEPFPLHLQDR